MKFSNQTKRIIVLLILPLFTLAACATFHPEAIQPSQREVERIKAAGLDCKDLFTRLEEYKKDYADAYGRYIGNRKLETGGWATIWLFILPGLVIGLVGQNRKRDASASLNLNYPTQLAYQEVYDETCLAKTP